MKRRTVSITEREYRALCSAVACYEVTMIDPEFDDEQLRSYVAEFRAMDRVLHKWREAGRS